MANALRGAASHCNGLGHARHQRSLPTPCTAQRLIAVQQKLTRRQLSTLCAAVKEKEAEAKIARLPSKKDYPAFAELPSTPNDEAILFQAFGWSSCEKGNWYDIVKEKVQALKDAGITHVWLPPPSQSVAPQGYLPGLLYNLNSSYGNKQQLQALNVALREAGIAPIADIVINHRCAQQQGDDGKWNDFRDDADHKGEPVDWGQWAITGDDPEFGGTGSADTGDDYGPAPDLDHTNEQLRTSLKDWMRWLNKEIGFAGWRFDFVKGYASYFMKEYVGETVGKEAFNVGEYWVDLRWGDNGLEYDQNGPRQTLVDWINGADGMSTLFDFVTKGILNEAVRNCEYWRLIDPEGKAPGLLGWWPSRAVTFIDNHDTGSTQQHWPFPHGGEETGYAYILTHPGVPCIMWEHFCDWGFGDIITQLIQARKRCGVTARSELKIIKAEGDLYMAQVGDRLRVKLGPRMDLGELKPNKDEGWQRTVDGKDFCVWELRN